MKLHKNPKRQNQILNNYDNFVKAFLKEFGFDLSWESTIDFENLCTLIICSMTSSHSVLQVLHMYFISFECFICTIRTIYFGIILNSKLRLENT